jgi:hypothetical protein
VSCGPSQAAAAISHDYNQDHDTCIFCMLDHLAGCSRCPAAPSMLLPSATTADFSLGVTACLESSATATTNPAAAPGKLLHCQNIGQSPLAADGGTQQQQQSRAVRLHVTAAARALDQPRRQAAAAALAPMAAAFGTAAVGTATADKVRLRELHRCKTVQQRRRCRCSSGAAAAGGCRVERTAAGAGACRKGHQVC